MAASSGNTSPATDLRWLRWIGVALLLVAVTCWWLLRNDQKSSDTRQKMPSAAAEHGGGKSREATRQPWVKRATLNDISRPTLEELTAKHQSQPDADEWERLLQILKQELPDPPPEEDREIMDAIMARFAAHAGAAQVDDLAALFQYSSSMEIGQRALETLSALQSEHFQTRARQVIADPSLSADDQVLTALARSLIRNGTPADLALVFDRIDSGKARGTSEFDGKEGLMAAIHGALDPEMGQTLCEALSNAAEVRSWQSRLAAAGALQHPSTSAATAALTDAVKNDPDPRVSNAAAESLAELRAVKE